MQKSQGQKHGSKDTVETNGRTDEQRSRQTLQGRHLGSGEGSGGESIETPKDCKIALFHCKITNMSTLVA